MIFKSVWSYKELCCKFVFPNFNFGREKKESHLGTQYHEQPHTLYLNIYIPTYLSTMNLNLNAPLIMMWDCSCVCE